jgi:NAD-reducing hydrogenase large subunit
MGERRIVIDPVTRIEGHARITLHLNEDGEVVNARFHVTQFRAFEKLCEGRPFSEMPSLMARICGICPVSHLIASAKACDQILGTRIPPVAVQLRRLLNLAQLVQSHALSFFYLSAPDFLLGMDSDPARRNLFGLIESHPETAREGIRLRKFGQQLIERLAGKRIHPAWVVPGGVSEPLPAAARDAVLAELPEMRGMVQRTLGWFKSALEPFREEAAAFANFPTLFLGLVGPDGELEHYDGHIRVVDAAGRMVADDLVPERYRDYLGEAVEPDSYLKSPYYKPGGYPDGMYRVGPLARLNLADRCGTHAADQEWAEFRQRERGAVLSSFYYHYARLVEMLYALERIEQILGEREILSRHVRAHAAANHPEGIGVAEAPRGTLIHHYRVDEAGVIQWANLIIATGHNNLAMNRGILQAARRFVDGNRLSEGALNRVEAVIRAFDPCLSCSTHAVGRMALRIELRGPAGELMDEVRRGA